MSEKLVDYLADTCSLYISDLRFPENSSLVLSAVKNLSPLSFPADDWSESLSYLFGKQLKFESSALAKKYCINTLTDKSLFK